MRAAFALGCGLLLACATAPRPRVLSEVDAARESATAREAEKQSPQAHARAERLRDEALRAHDDGDPAGAQILGEHALAAYEHAGVLTRLVAAERTLGDAETKLASAQKALADLDEQQKRLAAEADAVELSLKVALDAVPLVPNAPTGPEREKARLESARAMSTQARLSCVAAKLLNPRMEGLAAEMEKLDSLDEKLASRPEATPIDEAIRARSACLRILTLTRRGAGPTSHGASAVVDTLLSELSRGGHRPLRDDRGIVVTLRSVVHRDALTTAAEQALATLAAVAKANPRFPVLVVAHAGPRKTGKNTAELVANRLRAAGAATVDAREAGSWLPVADPARRDAPTRNERVEVVFVAPE